MGDGDGRGSARVQYGGLLQRKGSYAREVLWR